MDKFRKEFLKGCIATNLFWMILIVLAFWLLGNGPKECYPAYLGEFEQGENITIYGQFNTETGEQASPGHVTGAWCSLFDSGDASDPTASGSMIEIGKGQLGLFKYIYNGCIDPQLASGECIARIYGTVGGIKPAALHNFFIVDTGHSPNKRSILTTSDNIGINWADVANPSTAVDLSATDIQLADTTTAVTNAVTVGTNNDKTGYSLASGQLSPIIDSLDIDHTMRTTRDASDETVKANTDSLKDSTEINNTIRNTYKASDETVATNVATINTNTDGDGTGGIDADIATIAGYTDTLEASLSTVTLNQDRIRASLQSVMAYVDILPTSAPVSWNDTQDADSIYSWITTDGNIVQDAELNSAWADIKDLEEGIKQTLNTMYASLNTVTATGVLLIDNNTNRAIIAGAMRTENVASAEAVYGSIVQKLNDAGSSIQTVYASITAVRNGQSLIIDEVRKWR